jgi:hypothetical protein
MLHKTARFICRNIFLLIFLLALFGFNLSDLYSTDEVKINLKKGQNFISLPLSLPDPFIQQAFYSIDGKYSNIWHYDNSDPNNPWKHYHADYMGFSDLYNLTLGLGYWVEATQDTTLTITGTNYQLPFTHYLKEGWNAIGWPYKESQDIQNALYSLNFGTDYNRVCRFNPLSKSFEDYPAQFTTFDPGRAYYIYALRGCQATVLSLPQIMITQPSADTLFENTPQITVSGKLRNGNHSVKVNNVSANVTNETFSANVTLVEGGNTITAVATNAAGNTASDSITVSLKIIPIDITPPDIQITSPANNHIFDTSLITVSGTIDDASARVTVKGVPASVNGTTFTASGVPLLEGKNTILATATDPVGNKRSDFVTVELRTPCAVPSIDPVKSPTNITKQTIMGGKSVDAAQIIVTCPTAAVGQVEYPTSITWSCELDSLSEGENTIDVVAKNVYGNASAAVSTSVFLDTIGPRLNPIVRVVDEKNIELTYDGEVIDGHIDANYSVTPNLGTITAWSRGGNVYCLTTAGRSIAGTNYTVTVENVTDLLGNSLDPNYNTAAFVGTTLGSPTLLVAIEAEEDKDGFSYCSVASAGDINGDGFSDVLVGTSGRLGDNAHLYFGGPSMDEISDVTLMRDISGDEFGYSVASCGDLNGDGYADIVVGAPTTVEYDTSGAIRDVGRAYVYFGGPSMDGIADVVLFGEQKEEYLGCSVASAGDLNGDGYDDLIIGSAYPYSFWATKQRRVSIYFGGASMDNVVDIILEDQDVRSNFGTSLASAGDVNSDGFSDIIVGAPGANMVYIYFGGPSMDNVADLSIDSGEDSGGYFGASVASAGDVNKDGFPDIVVGAPMAENTQGDSSGRAYIYFGGPAMDSESDLIIDGEKGASYYPKFGTCVASAGDVNNDGFSDVIVGAPEYEEFLFWEDGDHRWAGHKEIGKAYIYFGGPTMSTVADVTITREIKYGNLGCAVASAGDINGDGFDEFIIGASEPGYGEAYVYTLAPIPPRLSAQARVIDARNVEVSYSEEVKEAELIENYTILPGLGDITISDRGNNVYRLTFTSIQEAGESYTISVTGVMDVDEIPLDPAYSQAVFIGYDSTSVPSVDSFQVFDLDTEEPDYTDSPVVGVTITESDPDGRIVGWLINEESTKPAMADFVLNTTLATYIITGGEGSRTIYAWVMDIDGNISELSSNSQAAIVLDTTAPKLKITSPSNDSLFSSSPVDVSGSIDDITFTEIKVNGVEATVGGGRFAAKGIVLQQGVNIIAAAAEDAVGHSSSDNITVILDTTPPVSPKIIDDGDYTMSLSGLHASWSSVDVESGIIEYRYAIGTTAGGTDVVGWTSAGTDIKITRSDLMLKPGKTYYFAVVAVNGVGLESEPGISDGIELSLAMAKTWITEPDYGQIIYDDITVNVNALASLGISRVEFYLDDELQYTDISFPYEWDWNIAGTSPGTHILKVRAYDIMNNITVDQIVTFSRQCY